MNREDPHGLAVKIDGEITYEASSNGLVLAVGFACITPTSNCEDFRELSLLVQTADIR
jgi:hypothetical protein